jgi:hypothetical protein
MRTKTVFAVVSIFLVISFSFVLLPSYDDVDGFGNSNTIAISSAEELALIGNDEMYPLDGNYVQRGNIDFEGKDLNGGFILVVNVTLQSTTLKIDLRHANGNPITSGLDILASVNGIIKVIPEGSSSVSFDVISTNVLTVSIILGGMADLIPFGMNPYFSVAKVFDIKDSETVSMSFKSNGNMDPIGSGLAPFIGTYNGNGYKITGLQTASYSTGGNAYAGLFGNVGIFATFNNIDLEISASAVSQYLNAYSGGIAGYVSNQNINISNCYVTGYSLAEAAPPSPYAGAYAGGLIGYVEGNSNIINCYDAVDVTSVSSSYSYSGGIAGGVNGDVTIHESFNTGTITSTSNNATSGGLIGSALNITITGCNAIGDVSSTASKTADSGGFVGSSSKFVVVKESYVIGNTSASASNSSDTAELYSGGLIGKSTDLSIADCYVKGNVSSLGSSSNVLSGGFAGYAETSANIVNGYVLGEIVISGAGCKGGIGNFENSNNYITNCYYLKTATINTDLDLYGAGTVIVDGMSSGTRVEYPSGGYDNDELRIQDNFYSGTTAIGSKFLEGWNFTRTWYIETSALINDGYPIIRSSLSIMDLADVYVTIGDAITFVANTNDKVTNYQWQMYDNNLMIWIDIPNETGMNYNIGGIMQDDIEKIYRCEVRTIINGVTIATKASGPGQILLKDTTYSLEISNMEELSKVGSNEIVNGMIFRPDGNYVQTNDLIFAGTDDLNGGFDMFVDAVLNDTKLTISLHYGDLGETPILSAYGMSVAVNGVADKIKPGESSVVFTVPAGITDLDIIAGGNADNIPVTMDEHHPNFTIRVFVMLSGGSARSDIVNSNGNMDPIGSVTRPFDGKYDGMGYKISGLRTMSFSVKDAYSALFGHARMITLKSVYLENNLSIASSIAFSEDDAPYQWDTSNTDPPDPTPDLSSSVAFSGGLIGYSGGIVTLDDCYTTGDVRALGTAFSGGLVGLVEGHIFITNSHTTGSVLSLYTVSFSGGLVGVVGGNTIISNSYNTGDVSAQSFFASISGGLIGVTGGSSLISGSYVAANVTSSGLVSFTGGFAGVMSGSSTIIDCYVIGDISSTLSTGVLSFSGGLAGYFEAEIFIVNCYVKGEITADSTSLVSVGGIGNLVNANNYITNSHYLKTNSINVDMDYYGSGYAVINGGITGREDTGGLTLDELRNKDSYETETIVVGEETVKGWDFETIWCIDQDSSLIAEQRANNGLPFLRALAFSEQPKDIISDDPLGKTFEVRPSMPPTGYQWQKSIDGNVWDDIIGETSDSYTTVSGDELNDQFRCIISYGSESIPSEPAGVLKEYTITTDHDPSMGKVRLSAEKVTIRDTVSILITPKAGYIGIATTDIGTLTPDGDNKYLLSGVTGDCTVTIGFDTVEYTVTTDHDIKKGSVVLSAVTTTVEDTVTITIGPGSGYAVGNVTVNTGTIAKISDTVYRLTSVTENCIVMVTFDAIEYTVTADHDAGKGRINLSTNRATVESNVWVTVIPDTGYMIGNVTTNTGKLENTGNGTYTLKGITKNCVVTVEFVPENYSVTANYDHDKGEVKLSAAVVTMKDTVLINIKANGGYSAGDVSTNTGTLVKTGDNEYRLTNIVKDCIIMIEFKTVPDPTPPAEDDMMLFLIIGAIVIMAILGIIGAIWFFRFRT